MLYYPRMGKIIGGLIITAIGALITVKTEWLYQNFGSNDWAEAKLGSSGGSRLLYRLIGIGICFIGILMATNLIGGFLDATVIKFLVPSR